MPIEDATDTRPGVSLINVGDSFKWALIDVNTYDVRKFGSGELTDKKGYVLTVYTIDPGQAVTGNQTDGYNPINAGDVLNIYVASYSKYDPNRDKITAPYMSWMESARQFGKVGAPETVDQWVGLIGEWKFLEQLKPSTAGISGRKDRKFRLRKPNADEADIVAKCHAVLSGPAEPTPATPLADDEEMPF